MSDTLTPATRSDLDSLLALRRHFCLHEHLEFRQDATQTALEELLDNPSLGRVWLISCHGAIAGYLVLTFGFSLEFNGRDAFIDELYVEERFRGKGLGRLAIRHAEQTCCAAGVRALHLEVDRGNHRARGVYQEAGFRDRDNHLLTKLLIT